MNNPTPDPDDATLTALWDAIAACDLGTTLSAPYATEEGYSLSPSAAHYLAPQMLAMFRAGKIPLPEDVPQIAALRARVAELEATATYAGKGTAKDWAEMCGAAENKVEELEHGLAELEAQAKRCWRACGRRGASGERRMYKQQPAIDCDAAITAFLEGK